MMSISKNIEPVEKTVIDDQVNPKKKIHPEYIKSLP